MVSIKRNQQNLYNNIVLANPDRHSVVENPCG